MFSIIFLKTQPSTLIYSIEPNTARWLMFSWFSYFSVWGADLFNSLYTFKVVLGYYCFVFLSLTGNLGGGGVWAGKAAKFKVGFRDIDLKELFRRSRGAIPLPRPIREDLPSCPLFVTFGKNSHLWQEETTLYMRFSPLILFYLFFIS